MRKICKVTVNNEPYLANCGELLLDWALDERRRSAARLSRRRLRRLPRAPGRRQGVRRPEPGDDMIHACQARIVSDLAIATEAVARSRLAGGAVAGIVRLAPDISGVDVECAETAAITSPANIASCSFAAFRRDLTARPIRWKAAPHDRLLHFHIRGPTGGTVSSALGRHIRHGHRVKTDGPFGSAFFREGHAGRIVLVASGTGFAPMWSVAVAAIMERPQRELVFIVAARNIRSLYMHAALCRLALFPNVTIIPAGVGTAERLARRSQRAGRPSICRS